VPRVRADAALSCLVFDLDGTLCDPVEGIGNAINHALACCGYPAATASEVSNFIGPPLDVGFRRLTAARADADIERLIAAYRDYYGRLGVKQNTLYPGIREALETIAAGGTPMGVCTSKRRDFALAVLDDLDLRDFFSFVDGGDVGVRKDTQLAGLIATGTIDQGAIMIGDRDVDILAARANGLRSVAVTWGHGSAAELAEAGPDHVLSRPEELTRLVALLPPLER
jgi:phosphoglycolate phosphatase